MQCGGPKCKKLFDFDGIHLNNTWFVLPNGIFILIMYVINDQLTKTNLAQLKHYLFQLKIGNNDQTDI